MLHEGVTTKIIKAFYAVYNTLGYGFLEKVYENALAIELKKSGFKVEQQKNIKVYYDTEEVGNYFADLFVNDLIIIELKASENICEEHKIQLINYLKSTKTEVGLLFNFGVKPEIKRTIFTNDKKKSSKPITQKIRENQSHPCHPCSIN
ncbi:MAG: GxxExxY protein [Chitinivibrionales bacterium]|nr:GxxExxY protein [Chitinivibrionales bacterium]